MSDQPSTVRRASFPPDYGTRGGDDDEPLAWRDIEDRLRDAPNYWVLTVAAGRRPHARPVDGVSVDGALCFGGSPEARWVRNLQENPAISVHLPSGDEVVILEGIAEYVTDPDHPLAEASTKASKAKYPQYFPGDHPVVVPTLLVAAAERRLRVDSVGLPEPRDPVDVQPLR